MTIALYPGAFKPPHKGHFDVVKKLLEITDKVIILVSSKQRNVYLRNVTDLNAEMAGIYKSLTRVLPQVTRTTLENELSRPEKIKAYITTDR